MGSAYRKEYKQYRCPYCSEIYEATDEEAEMFELYECPKCNSEVDYDDNKVRGNLK